MVEREFGRRQERAAILAGEPVPDRDPLARHRMKPARNSAIGEQTNHGWQRQVERWSTQHMEGLLLNAIG